MKLKTTRRDKYYILLNVYAPNKKIKFISVSGVPVRIKGWEQYDLFIHRDKFSFVQDKWAVSEAISGQRIRGGVTQEEAKQKSLDILSRVTHKVFDDMIERSVEDYGISPRYGGNIKK